MVVQYVSAIVPCSAAATPEALPTGRTSPTPLCHVRLPEYERTSIWPPASWPPALSEAVFSDALLRLPTVIEPPSPLCAPSAVAANALPLAVTPPDVDVTRIDPATSLLLLPSGLELTEKIEESAGSGPKTLMSFAANRSARMAPSDFDDASARITPKRPSVGPGRFTSRPSTVMVVPERTTTRAPLPSLDAEATRPETRTSQPSRVTLPVLLPPSDAMTASPVTTSAGWV